MISLYNLVNIFQHAEVWAKWMTSLYNLVNIFPHAEVEQECIAAYHTNESLIKAEEDIVLYPLLKTKHDVREKIPSEGCANR